MEMTANTSIEQMKKDFYAKGGEVQVVPGRKKMPKAYGYNGGATVRGKDSKNGQKWARGQRAIK